MLLMFLTGEEVNEYCKVSEYNGITYLIEDMEELQEDCWIATENKSHYAIAVDDNRWHRKDSCVRIEENGEYVFDRDYLEEHYGLDYQTSK